MSSTTFFNSSGITAYGSDFTGLVDATNVVINPAREDGNLTTIAGRLNVNLSTIATEVTLAALNTKVTTTANGIKVDATATTQPVSGTVSANMRDGSGNALTSTTGSLDVNVTGGSTASEEHTLDSAGDTYIAGTTQGIATAARVVAAAPSLTAGQFSDLNVSLAGRLIVDGSGVTQPISAASLPLPTGAATEATLALVNTNLDQLNYSGTRLLVDGSGVTQPVSGTVTANIGTTNGLALDATLSAASAKLPATLGQKTMANSLAVVVASDQSNLPSNVAAWGGSATTLGQKLMAASVPVTLSSDQSALLVAQSGTWNINNISGTISLPTGAATQATLAAVDTKLSAFTFASTRLLTDGSGVTQPISAASLPLPTGAATSANQTTGNASLSSIDTKTPSLGQAAMAASSPVVIASNQSAVPVSGTVTVTQSTAGNLNATVVGTVTANVGTTGGLALDATLTGGTAKFQLVDTGGTVADVSAANALKVDGSAVTQPVSAASLPLPTGAATETTLAAASAKLPATLGQKTMANSLAVVVASDQSNLPVAIATSITLPVNNAQWGGAATSLGQKAMTASVPVVLSSDQSSIPVTQSGTWNINNVSGTVSLPTGAATAANQTTSNASLSSIDGKTPALGQAAMAASSPVVIASNQTAIPVTDNSGSLTVDATALDIRALTATDVVSARMRDGAGTALTSTGGALDVNISGGSITVGINGDQADLDSGAGTDDHEVFAIGLPGAGGHVVGGTSTNPLRTDPTGTTTQPISAASLPLPTGAATEATLAAVDTKLGAFTFASTRLLVDGSGVTQPISAVSLPLPTGAATAANQATANASLSSIDGKTPALVGGRVPVDGSGVTQPVSGTITANIGTTGGLALETSVTGLSLAQGSTTAGQQGTLELGAVTTAAPTYTTGQTSPLSLTTTGLLRTDGSGVTQPVSGTITANQGGTWNINNVSGTVSLPTGAATEATSSAISGKLPATLGQKAMTASLAVAIASDQSNIPVTLSGTAAANITQWGGTSTTLGQKAMTASVPVTLASDQSALSVTGSGNFTVIQGTGTNLHTVVDSGSITVTQATPANLNATVSQATGTNLHTVVDSGTITANIGTTNGLALNTTVAQLNVSQSTALGANTGPMMQGSVTTSAPSYSTGNINPLSLTTAGALRVDNSANVQPTYNRGGDRATYRASVSALAPAASATDIFTITGSASTTVRIKKIEIDFITSSTDIATLNVIKRSTANSGGTSSTRTAVPLDSNSAAAGATVLAYTANPTLGTAVGTLASHRVYTADATPAAASPGVDFAAWESHNTSQDIVLRGTSQVLALNLAGTTPSGSSLFIFVEWTEEA